MIAIFSYNPDKMMYRLQEFDNDSVDRYFDVPAEEVSHYFSTANGGKNRMDTKRCYHSELSEFVNDDRVTKESVIEALSDVIGACEQHDDLLTKSISGKGCFEDTLARIMDELTPKPNGGKNKMDTKRCYHFELAGFISDDRVTKESVIVVLSELIAACEQHDDSLIKWRMDKGCFEDTLARIMNELTPKPDPLDESNKSPRIDSDGDKWEWSEFLCYWVLTEPNKVTNRHVAGISPDDPGYCYHHSDFGFDTIHSIAEWCGPLEYASV